MTTSDVGTCDTESVCNLTSDMLRDREAMIRRDILFPGAARRWWTVWPSSLSRAPRCRKRSRTSLRSSASVAAASLGI